MWISLGLVWWSMEGWPFETAIRAPRACYLRSFGKVF